MFRSLYKYLGSEHCEYVSIAFLYHCILLLILALIISYSPINKNPILIVSSQDVELIPEIDPNIEQIDIFSNQIQPINNNEIINTSENITEQIEINHSIDSDNTSEFVTNNELDNLGEETLSLDAIGINTNTKSNTIGENSLGGALDRLTLEIIQSANQKDTNVIWLMDSSISLYNQRQNIHDRISNILQQISVEPSEHKVQHRIVSFGQSCINISKEFTNDSSTLKEDIKRIVIDNSGIENIFSAINYSCIQSYKKNSRLLVIVFTDETGEDVQYLDAVSSLCRKQGTMIYVVGNPAPFGKSKAQFRFVEFDQSYKSEDRWVEIDQGPETIAPIVLNIKSLPIDNETLDSGFGPFALSKLCLDTGGIYFSVHPDRDKKISNKNETTPLNSYISYFFDALVMNKYNPDYRSISIQTIDINKSQAKSSLVKACQIPLHISNDQRLKFHCFTQDQFIQELNDAQKFAAKIEPQINQIYQILITGEKDLSNLSDKRWIASYYLALGRILNAKCRIELYNSSLAQAKFGIKKQQDRSNIFILEPTNKPIENSQLQKLANLGKHYLELIVKNYPETPWSLIAQCELDCPVSYAWKEDYETPPSNKDGGGGGNGMPKDDMKKPKLIPKPIRKLDKI